MASLKIIIVGAGKGGLAAATGLARNGHQVTVYERSTSTSEIGYAFRITPNSDRCLKCLGIDTVAGGAVAANSSRMFNAEGQVVFSFKENNDVEKAKRGTSVFAYRPQLHQQLLQVALDSGVKVLSGQRVESVDTGKTTIKLADGVTASADLVIAADGLHSAVRSHVIDSTRFSPKPSTGQSAIRFMLSKSVVQNDSIMSTMVDEDSHMFSWKGNNKRILVYPVDYDQQYNITCTYPSNFSSEQTSNKNSAAVVAYNQKISFDTALDIYSDFDPIAKRLFSLADPDGFRAWQLQDMDDHPSWSVNHTTLLGDACHAVLPFGFSGASMAIEDGVTISTLLSPDVRAEDLSARLKLYEEVRRPRVAKVRESSLVLAKGLEDKEFMQEYMMFLSSHDAVEYAKQALSRYLETASGKDATDA
ncbi:MAG: hypothetical protein ALECFALPRED_008417 [Alectoria fallacina]|uniref:FAD-binding domain-containing protein n=1 Tax=Alectoria fallacina TaxID=1903189 RepID=A0A8H3J3I6_9LECA|nr:MAG: hypothetical protein ALECFALPRED_008417 [Alectoria fallacina]